MTVPKWSIRLCCFLLHLAAAQEGPFLRSAGQSERMHIVRRLYGEENALVRREISKLEERIPRYQTGLPPSDHIVPYENHPFDPDYRRSLQESNSTTTAKADNFKPIRIVFQTQALDSIRDTSNAAKIDWIKREILPSVADFWKSALSVIPVSGRLRISSSELVDFAYCGDSEFTEVPNSHKSDGLANVDLILYVSASNSPRFCPARTLAVALPCNFDQFDRPTAGSVNVCLDNIVLQEDGSATEDVVRDYHDVVIHEVGHGAFLGVFVGSFCFARFVVYASRGVHVGEFQFSLLEFGLTCFLLYNQCWEKAATPIASFGTQRPDSHAQSGPFNPGLSHALTGRRDLSSCHRKIH